MTPAFILFGADEVRPVCVSDLVVLRSGGLPMTVLSHCGECGEVDVAYCDSDGDIEILTLPAAALQHYVEDDE